MDLRRPRAGRRAAGVSRAVPWRWPRRALQAVDIVELALADDGGAVTAAETTARRSARSPWSGPRAAPWSPPARRDVLAVAGRLRADRTGVAIASMPVMDDSLIRGRRRPC